MKKKVLKYRKETIKKNLLPGDILEVEAKKMIEVTIITKRIKLI